jgi:hypothetical protein
MYKSAELQIINLKITQISIHKIIPIAVGRRAARILQDIWRLSYQGEFWRKIFSHILEIRETF